MNIYRLTVCLLFVQLLAPLRSVAQSSPKHQLYLRNGVVSLPENIGQEALGKQNRQSSPDTKTLVIIQFKQIPDTVTQARLRDAGIELLEYIPNHAYTAMVTGTPDAKILKDAGARAFFQPDFEHKVDSLLRTGNVPDHARKVPGKIDVQLSFARTFSAEEVIDDIVGQGFEVIFDNLKSYQLLEVRIPEDSIRVLADFPWVQYIEPVSGPVVELNDRSKTNSRANVLGSAAPGGYGLTGEGVVVGMGDTSNPIQHPDVGNRVIDYTDRGNDWHGIHVGGTLAGSGLINEKYRGYAPKSSVIFRYNSGIWWNSPDLVRDYGMVVTSNTYGSSYGSCPRWGAYGDESYALDLQALDLPSLQHVFAGGNSGNTQSCAGMPLGFNTIYGDYQSAKNVITVGRTDVNGALGITSSKGPVRDGRIKPELTAPGTGIYSSMLDNSYQPATGTSMASPAVTGGIALLYQRYRQLHQQNNPKNALIKALVCNGATDQGLPGPDYSYGFGNMNLLRSVTMLDKGHYFNGQVSLSAKNIHEISVPANTAQLKVMLYWNDPAPSLLGGGKSLVNDLDLKILRPGNTPILPKFPSAANPMAPAVAGIDTINNIEQIVIDAPAAGTYSVQIVGSTIPQAQQDYYVVYDLIETSTGVTYPLAGEHLTKGDVVNIAWDSYGPDAGTFNVSYSLDNGGSWTTINAAVAADLRLLSWTVPDASTGNAKIRVIQNTTGVVSEGGPFTIIGVPVVSLQTVQCESYIALQWNAVSGATDYEVMITTGGEMKSAGVTNALKFVVTALLKDSTYYLSVRARKNQVPGRRSVAVKRKPDTGTCQGAISDNDLKIDSLVTPAPVVRQFTSVAYTADQAITVRIKNLDDQPQTKPFQIGYSLGAETFWESVSASVPKGGTLDYTFQRRANLSAVGQYPLVVRVKLNGDPVSANDSLALSLRQLPNPKIALPYFQDLESLPAQDIRTVTFGIPGAEAFDVTDLSTNGRLRTALNPVVAYSGQRAFVMDKSHGDHNNGATNTLEANFNLSGYSVMRDDIRLSFRHYHQYGGNYKYVFIRGNSADDWILARTMSFFDHGEVDKDYKLISIDLSALLLQNGQEYSSSFQVRWFSYTWDAFPSDGSVIDDISLFKTTSDIEMIYINAAQVPDCGSLSNNAVSTSFRNNGNDDCTNLRIKMQFDNEIVEREIPLIRKGSTESITFYYPYEIYTQGTHILKIWSEKNLDINPANDTARVELITPQVITANPYLENFESGPGGWYTEGSNSSWEFGTPASSKVKSAASGDNVWKTNLTGPYNNDEYSYLYSPCISTNLSYSTLSFSAFVDMEQSNNIPYDRFYVECNNGYGWYRLGAVGDGVNWYNSENEGVGFWRGKVTSGWRVFTVSLPSTYYLRIRFVFNSNSSITGEGVAIDDIHIYNLYNNIYTEGTTHDALYPSYNPVDDNWKIFGIDGKIIASINPRGQNISSTRLKEYVHDGAPRVSNNQFLLDRSFVIESGENLTNPVGVRLYVPDQDVEKLIAATGNASAGKPGSAYELSVTKYSGMNQDGQLGNNLVDGWDFFPSGKVTKVPYGSGYYLEFETKSFSEFWLAKDYAGTGKPLPVELISFNAEKSTSADGTFATLKWATATETDFSHFTVQVAVGLENVKKGLFYDLGTVEGAGGNEAQQYAFKDGPLNAGATRYYRLKMVDTDGSFRFSRMQAITFDQLDELRVFPNPSRGLFKFELAGEHQGAVQMDVYDVQGKLRQQLHFQRSESKPTLEADLSSPDFAAGLYIIKIKFGDVEKQVKVMKE